MFNIIASFKATVSTSIICLFCVCTLSAQTTVFINEIHYDNAGLDLNQQVEIAGPADTDLTGWIVYLYNGNTGGFYATAASVASLPTIAMALASPLRRSVTFRTGHHPGHRRESHSSTIPTRLFSFCPTKARLLQLAVHPRHDHRRYRRE